MIQWIDKIEGWIGKEKEERRNEGKMEGRKKVI